MYFAITLDIHLLKSSKPFLRNFGEEEERLINGDLESDSYRRLKLTTKEEVSRIQSSLAQLKVTDTNFMKYCRWGQTSLTHLPTFTESNRRPSHDEDFVYDKPTLSRSIPVPPSIRASSCCCVAAFKH